MRKYGYQRPSATLRVTRKRPARRKKPSFFFKFLFLLFLLIVLLGALFFGGRYLYFTLKNAQITDWHVKSVAVEGLSGVREKEIFNKVVALEGKPFSGNFILNLRRTRQNPQNTPQRNTAAYPLETSTVMIRPWTAYSIIPTL